MWEISSQSKLLFSLGDLKARRPFSLLKRIRCAVCSPRRRITQPSVWDRSLFLLFSHYLVFSKAMTDVLLPPTLLLAAMDLSSLRELPAPNLLRLILPYLILAGTLFEVNPEKIYHDFLCLNLSLRNSFAKLNKTIIRNKLNHTCNVYRNTKCEQTSTLFWSRFSHRDPCRIVDGYTRLLY